MEVVKEETRPRPRHATYKTIIAGLGIVLWVGVVTLPIPLTEPAAVGLIGIFFALLTFFPIQVLGIEITLNHMVFLGALMIFDPAMTAWAAVAGIGLGGFVRSMMASSKGEEPHKLSILVIISRVFYEIGLLLFPLFIAVVYWVTFLSADPLSFDVVSEPEAYILYVITHAVLLSAAIWQRPDRKEQEFKDILLTLVLVEVLPLLFIIIAALAYPTIHLWAFGIIGGIPVLTSLLLRYANRNRATLVRRVQDLSLLNEVSEVIRYSADLEKLLEVIHNQTADLLGVKNFYVAIYDSVDDTVWYPYAVKHDEIQTWERRPLMNRLTDRVIQEQQALMLPKDAHKELEDIGAPLGEEPLFSWLGVPLITPNGTIGCLAVFSLTPDVGFAEEDLNLLTTLSGQVSIPLENALTIEQSGRTISRQTKQLSIMETIGRQLSASLHSDDVFELILGYAMEFTNSPKGSLSISDPLVDDFVPKVHRGYERDMPESGIIQSIPERVIRTGEPVMFSQPGSSEKDDSAASLTLSQLTVPIINNSEVIGIINLESPKLNEYTDNELNFVSQLADQATLAINNAALYEKAQRSLREQATLYMISARLAAYNELESVLNGVAQAFSAALGSYLSGVYLWDVSNKRYQCMAVMERSHEGQVELPLEISDEDWQEIKKRKTVTGPLQVSGEQKLLANIIGAAEGSQSLIFPLQIANQHIGLVVNHLPDQPLYQDTQLQFPQAIASQSAIAIQNALLFSDVSKGFDRLETVLNAVGEGVLMVDADSRVTLANKPIETITNKRFSEITGKKLTDLAPDICQPLGLTPEELQSLSHLSAGEEEVGLGPRTNYEYQERYYERMVAPVWAANEQVLGWVIVIRDITEEEQVSQTRELLTETLVHDLRSPIGAIKTTLDLIEEGLPKSGRDPVTDQSIDIAKRSTDRVLALINSLLDISQLESGNVDIQTDLVAVKKLVEDVVSDLVQQANEDGVILRMEDFDDLPKVKVDVNLIRRVLINLLDNALKFTPEGGIVTVESAEDIEGFVTIRVKDTGPGIPEDYREIVFTRFSQVPGLMGRRRGSGLGLTFCRLVIEAHQGRIWVESGKDDAGTTLVFTLPIAEDEAG